MIIYIHNYIGTFKLQYLVKIKCDELINMTLLISRGALQLRVLCEWIVRKRIMFPQIRIMSVYSILILGSIG
jgi:hypothetical protein